MAKWGGLFCATASALFLLLTVPAWASVRVDLDGDWRFRTDPASQASTYDPAVRLRDPSFAEATRLVQVPHSWNIGADHDFDGVGWYFKSFTLPDALAHQHLELNFDAVFSQARVWVNGVEVGRHVGGYTAFALDVSKAVRAGENRIAVAVDNRPGFATVPGYAMRLKASGSVWYDWWRNGGLVRDVWLNVGEGGLIRRQALTSTITPATATVRDTVMVDNVSSSARTYRLVVTARGPDGSLAGRAERRVELAAGRQATSDLTLTIPNPKLWNIGAAQLYQITAELQDVSGLALDTRSDSYGLRTIEIRDRRLYVNGRAVRLTGVSRHEDSPAEGLAETRGTIRQDWNDLAALHTTLTRPVHYPQAASVYDAADRAGVLLVPEIPVWQMTEVQLKDPRLIANAQAMMREMIEQAGNHPSIFAWSVCNESAASTPGGRAYVQAMKAMIHKLDPGRFVTFADADVSTAPWTREAVMDDADFIMANAYFGTWSGQAQAVEPWLDFMDRTYPDKLVIISEFGWPGPFSADAVAADKDRIDNLANQMAAFERRPFVGGAIFWTYQDYKSNRNLTRGEVEGYVDHGLVDQNRQRKPSYAVWERRNRALDLAATWRVGPAGLEGFTATAAPVAAGRLPSYALIGYIARWRVVSEAGEVLDAGEAPLDLSAAATLTRAWTPRPGLERATLSLEILTSAGDRADATTLDYQTFRLGAAPFPPDPKQLPSEVKP